MSLDFITSNLVLISLGTEKKSKLIRFINSSLPACGFEYGTASWASSLACHCTFFSLWSFWPFCFYCISSAWNYFGFELDPWAWCFGLFGLELRLWDPFGYSLMLAMLILFLTASILGAGEVKPKGFLFLFILYWGWLISTRVNGEWTMRSHTS